MSEQTHQTPYTMTKDIMVALINRTDISVILDDATTPATWVAKNYKIILKAVSNPFEED